MSTSRRRPAFSMAILALALTLVVQATSCFSPSEVVLRIFTDMNVGQDFNTMVVGACTLAALKQGEEDEPACSYKVAQDWQPHWFDEADLATATLPATLGLYFGDSLLGDGSESVRLHIEICQCEEQQTPSFQGCESCGGALFALDETIQARAGESIVQDVSLPYLCSAGVARSKIPCSPSQVCDSGVCVDKPKSEDCSLEESLAACGDSCGSALCAMDRVCRKGECVRSGCPYTDDRTGPFADAQCMDVGKCFEGATPVLAKLDNNGRCVLMMEQDPSCVNLAVVPAVPSCNGGVCEVGLCEKGTCKVGFCDDVRCLVPLDDLPKLGGELPTAICEDLADGKIAGLLAAPITADCPRKTPSVVPVSDLSSVTACRPKPASAAGPTGTKSWTVRGSTSDVKTWADRFLHAAAPIDTASGTELLVTGGGHFEGSLFEPSNLQLDAPYYQAKCFDPGFFRDGLDCLHGFYDLLTPRAGHTATTVVVPGTPQTPERRRVLVAGGLTTGPSGAALVAASEEFIPFPEVPGFTSGPPMKAPRAFHTATALKDGLTVLFAGGVVDGPNGMIPTNSVETYKSGVFSLETPMKIARVGHTATLLDNGDILVVGGQGSLAGDGDLLGSAELVALAGACLEPAVAMIVPRAFHAAAKLKDGQVLVTGGAKLQIGDLMTPGGISKLTSSTGVYNCAIGCKGVSCKWDELPPMHYRRALHVATTLKDGKVLVVGGVGVLEDGVPGEHLVPTTQIPPELYNPATKLWTVLAAPEAAYRLLPTATPLENGSVVFLGGAVFAPPSGSQPIPTLLSVEPLLLYTPSE